jgi:hypothetical protein
MKPINLSIIISIFIFLGCTTIIEKNIEPKLTSLMMEQQLAWNNGNLEGFMKHYWVSDSLVFIGKNGPKYGWKQTLSNYQKSYPSPEKMGTLEFKEVYHVKTNGGDFRTVGNWNLYRTSDTLSGYFLLVWEYKNNRWVITADHSS